MAWHIHCIPRYFNNTYFVCYQNYKCLKAGSIIEVMFMFVRGKDLHDLKLAVMSDTPHIPGHSLFLSITQTLSWANTSLLSKGNIQNSS